MASERADVPVVRRPEAVVASAALGAAVPQPSGASMAAVRGAAGLGRPVDARGSVVVGAASTGAVGVVHAQSSERGAEAYARRF